MMAATTAATTIEGTVLGDVDLGAFFGGSGAPCVSTSGSFVSIPISSPGAFQERRSRLAFNGVAKTGTATEGAHQFSEFHLYYPCSILTLQHSKATRLS
jgi:hypothetical protein